MKRYPLCKVCAGILGVMFLLLRWDAFPSKDFGAFDGRPVEAAGRVSRITFKENHYGQTQIYLFLKSVTFRDKDFNSETTEKSEKQAERTPEKAEGVLCYLKSGEESPLIGQQVWITGKAEDFIKAQNPGEFDLKAYYRAQGISFAVKEAKIRKRGNSYCRPAQLLFELRQLLAKRLKQICGEDAGMMQAVLLGQKESLDGEIKALYQGAGISHLLAISGLHLSFLGMGLYRLLRKGLMPVFLADCLSCVFLAGYAAMTGGSASACRAAIMFVMCLLAEMLGRSYDRLTALAFSAVLVLCFGPWRMLGQSGFLLSYGAILGIEWISPMLKEHWEGRIASLFHAGSAIFLMTLPILLSSFYEVPLSSFFLNLLAIPLMSVVVGMGILALLVGMKWILAAQILFLPVHFLLTFFLFACRAAERLPQNAWITGKPCGWQIGLYYLLLLFLLLLGKRRTSAQFWLTCLCMLWIVSKFPVYGFSVTMLDVGQGDGIVLREEGHAVLIDCGSSSEKKLAEYTLLPYLKSQKITAIDKIFLTHMDADHINGAEELLLSGKREGISVGALVLPALETQDEEYQRICMRAKDAGIPVYLMGQGDRVRAGHMEITCLHPRREASYADRNDASLVLYLEYGADPSKRGAWPRGRFSALFAGDLDGEAESAFAAKWQGKLPQTTLLKAGHHGSKNSCREELLACIRPNLALISCGKKNSYGHPAKETLERLAGIGARIYRTDESGAVILRVRGGKVKVEEYG